MESVYAYCWKVTFVVIVMIWAGGCRHAGMDSRSSRVPEELQLPAIDPVPDRLNPREHPVLPWIASHVGERDTLAKEEQ